MVKAGGNRLYTLRDYSLNQVMNSARYGLQFVDSFLETKYPKMLATPLLDYTERSINYWLNEEYNNDELTGIRLYEKK